MARLNPTAQARPKDPGPLPAQPVSLAGAVTKGSASAKIALIEFTDFQCPFCGQFTREALPALEQQFVQTGKVLLALRNFPLGNHSLARKAAEAALCSGRQGKFWEMHDALFGKQALDLPSMQGSARALKLDTAAFSSCVADGQTAAEVTRDLAMGRAMGISGTPSFFLGQIQPDGSVRVTSRFSGAQSVMQIGQAIESMLAAR